MSFWIQHGYGKGRKIDDLIDSGGIGGVVLSPADEDQVTLRETVRHLNGEGVPCLLDPQTYVWGLPDGTARNHADHGLEFGAVHWSMSPTEIQRIVEAVITANQNLGLTEVITPTCLQRALPDEWSPLAVQLARATISVVGSERAYVSLVLGESALASWEALEQWLDLVTTFDAKGFYLIVARGSDPYLRPWDPTLLTNLLRITHRLGVVNEYDVLVGYADLDGLTCLASGAKGIATGWYYSLRAFAESKWQPSTGGRQARPRVTSGTLMTPLLADSEAVQLARSQLGPDVFDDGQLRTRLSSAGAWSIADAWGQHLDVARSLIHEVDASATGRERVNHVLEDLRRAYGTFQEASNRGIVLTSAYLTRIQSLGTALRHYAEEEGVI